MAVGSVSRADIENCPRWHETFKRLRKDRRYYEVAEDTILQGFSYGYFVLRDEVAEVRAIQPFFINDQDLLAGTGSVIKELAELVPQGLAAVYAYAELDGRMRCGRGAFGC